jgi:hypothetical protein
LYIHTEYPLLSERYLGANLEEIGFEGTERVWCAVAWRVDWGKRRRVVVHGSDAEAKVWAEFIPGAAWGRGAKPTEEDKPGG